MNTDTDLERMAREAGLMQYNRRDWCSEQTDGISAEDLARFADLIRADERERCAGLCDATATKHYASARTCATDYLPVQFRAAAEALTNAAVAIRANYHLLSAGQ